MILDPKRSIDDNEIPGNRPALKPQSYKKNVNSPSVAPLIRSPTLGREAQKG